MMDKFAIMRSIVGATGDHYAFQCHTGRPHQRQPQGGWPAMGSVLSKLMGRPIERCRRSWGLLRRWVTSRGPTTGTPGFLGVAHAPFKPNAEGKGDMVLNGVTLERLGDRKTLLASFDRFRREADASGMMTGIDTFNQQALGVLTSSKLLEALDLSKEDPKVVERYGKGDPKNRDDGGPKLMEQC